MPPELWSPYVWRLIHALMQKIDERSLKKPFELLEIAIFLRALANLLPCPECSDHFKQYLHDEFSHISTLDLNKQKWPPNGYFLWSVETRAHIARRLGRPQRDADYCKQEYSLDFFGSAWNALTIISFSYPPMVNNEEMMKDIQFFFTILSECFPNATQQQWSTILNAKGLEWFKNREGFIELVHRLRCETQHEPKLVQLSI